LVTLSRLCVPRFDSEMIPRCEPHWHFARDDNALVSGVGYQESSPDHVGERSTIPEFHHRITIASNCSSFWLRRNCRGLGISCNAF
jgi:hypothetical protein